MMESNPKAELDSQKIPMVIAPPNHWGPIEFLEPWFFPWRGLGWSAGGPRGDGVKRLQGSEVLMMQKIRRVG